MKKNFAAGNLVRIIGPITLLQTIWNAGGDPHGLWQIKKIFQSETGGKVVLLVMAHGNVQLTLSAKNIVDAEEAQT